MRKHQFEYLRALSEYAQAHLSEWRRTFSENIVGIHVDHRTRGDSKLRYYCIVFHVREKRREVDAKEQIPRKITVELPGFGTRNVPTDVLEVGEFRANRHAGHREVGPGLRVRNLVMSTQCEETRNFC